MASVLSRALADLEPPAPTLHDGPLQEPPDDGSPTRRGLRPAPPDPTTYGTLSIDEGQQMIRQAVAAYLNEPAPPHALLIAAPAGLGKTTLGVETAEGFAAGGGQVLYLGPRTDFYADLLPLMQHPSWWYAWQPRTIGKGQGVGLTCRYAPQIEAWMRRGYTAMDFCANPRICGWTYIHETCPWHAQERQAPPIIYGQYEHLSLGHPRLKSVGLLIGDELPLRAFLHPWHIPAADIIPIGMEPSARETIMRGLRRLCADAPKEGISGPVLLDALGGAAHVARVCADVALAELQPPELRHADAAEQAPYGHLLLTLTMLRREAETVVAGREAVHRVRVDTHGLTLYHARVPKQQPTHVIWLDATASAPLYRQLLGRPVEVVAPDVRMTGHIYQVWSSLNTKTHVGPAADGTPKLAHLEQQIAAILRRGTYQRPAYVSYKAVVGAFGDDADVAHFHGARGTNRLQDCDVLIVIGTPQPKSEDLVTTATMVYHQRMAPFNATWSTQDRPYAGQPWAHPASGFWDDTDLQTLLEQLREAEIVQALHRARPLRRDVDIYLLTNLPVPGVPVQLLSLHQLFNAPAGVDPYRWPAALQVAEERMATVGRVTTQDFSIGLGVDNRTASVWINGLIAQGWQEIARVPSATRGRPVRAVVKTLSPNNNASII